MAKNTLFKKEELQKIIDAINNGVDTSSIVALSGRGHTSIGRIKRTVIAVHNRDFGLIKKYLGTPSDAPLTIQVLDVLGYEDWQIAEIRGFCGEEPTQTECESAGYDEYLAHVNESKIKVIDVLGNLASLVCELNTALLDLAETVKGDSE